LGAREPWPESWYLHCRLPPISPKWSLAIVEVAQMESFEQHEIKRKLLEDSDIFEWHDPSDHNYDDPFDPFFIKKIYGYDVVQSFSGEDFLEKLIFHLEEYFNGVNLSPTASLKERMRPIIDEEVFGGLGGQFDQVVDKLRRWGEHKTAQECEALREKALDRLCANKDRRESFKKSGFTTKRLDLRGNLVFFIMDLAERYIPAMEGDREKHRLAAEILALFGIEKGGTDVENIERIVRLLEQAAKRHPMKPSQWEDY